MFPAVKSIRLISHRETTWHVSTREHSQIIMETTQTQAQLLCLEKQQAEKLKQRKNNELKLSDK